MAIAEATFTNIINISILCLELLYAIFAFIIIRQVKLMNNSFHTPIASFFTAASFLHFFASLILILVSFILLV